MQFFGDTDINNSDLKECNWFFFICYTTLNNTNLTLCNFQLCIIFCGHLITQLKVLLYNHLNYLIGNSIWDFFQGFINEKIFKKHINLGNKQALQQPLSLMKDPGSNYCSGTFIDFEKL